jgi:hypothetical protein
MSRSAANTLGIPGLRTISFAGGLCRRVLLVLAIFKRSDFFEKPPPIPRLEATAL